MIRFALALFVAPTLALAQAPAAPAVPAPPQAAAVAPAAQTVAVADAKVGTAVESLQLVGEAATFPSTVGKVFFWTKVTGGANQSITHAWYRDGQKVSEVALPLRFDSVRTYSYKTITADMKGAWKVEVLGPDGSALKAVEFQVAD